jgi:hypothetical protein
MGCSVHVHMRYGQVHLKDLLLATHRQAGENGGLHEYMTDVGA